MKLLFELLPLVAFFAAYKLAGIQAATLAALIASALQVLGLKLRRQPVSAMQGLSLIILTVLGGATLLNHDARFIQWKPTALYGVLALGLLITPRLTGRNPLQALLGTHIELPAFAWQRLTLAWLVFFIAMAALNGYVAQHYSLDDWVNFKLFGTLGLTLVFVLAQAIWMSRHIESTDHAPKQH